MPKSPPCLSFTLLCHVTAGLIVLLGADLAGAQERQSVEIMFESRGTTLVGTLHLPEGPGPHPAIVGAHGSGRISRSDIYLNEAASFFAPRGIAFFIFDKRGIGASGGSYPGSYSSSMVTYAIDVLSAVDALAQREDIDAGQIGLWGISQAGWIIPIAAAMEPQRVAFTIIVSGPTVSIAEENMYSDLTGQSDNKPSGLAESEIDRRLAEAEPLGIDASAFIAELTMPGLWIYGALDQSVPWRQGIEDLATISKEWNRDFTWHVFENGNHGLRIARTGGPWERPVPTKPVDGYFEVMADWLRAEAGIKVARR